MINILLLCNPYFNCETFAQEQYSHLYEDEFMKLGADKRPAYIERNFGEIPYKILDMLSPLNANVIVEHDSASFFEYILNSVLSGEIIHLIIVDVYIVGEYNFDFFQKLHELSFAVEEGQNIKDIPILLVCQNMIPDSVTENIRKIVKLARDSLHGVFYGGGDNLEEVCQILLNYREKLLGNLDMCGFVINFKEKSISIDVLFKELNLPSSYRISQYAKNAEKFIFMDKTVLLIQKSIEEFEVLLNTIFNKMFLQAAPKRQVENMLQQFLVKNPHFVYQNKFNKMWSQPLIYSPYYEQKQNRPNFVLKSTLSNVAELVELELPTKEAMEKTTYRLSRKIINSLEYAIKHKVSIENFPEYNLSGEVRNIDSISILIGGTEDYSRSIQRIISDNYSINDVKIVSYSELIEVQKSVVEGLLLLDSRTFSSQASFASDRIGLSIGNLMVANGNVTPQESAEKSKSKQFHFGKTAMIPILFLSADPTNASRLRLGEELREIQEKLQLAKQRERFELHQRMSARPSDISQALLDIQPKIVHFSGHGAITGALYFETQVGEAHAVQPDALAALFEQFANRLKCVILNACYSETQANAIAKHIDYVIGMNQAVGDKAAIAFAIGFYQAIGAGRTIEEAYKLGCVQIRLQGIPEHLTPVLIKRV
jgi:hypothetical protein